MMKNEIHNGSLVRVKSYEDIVKTCGDDMRHIGTGVFFSDDMIKYCDKFIMIRDVNRNSSDGTITSVKLQDRYYGWLFVADWLDLDTIVEWEVEI